METSPVSLAWRNLTRSGLFATSFQPSPSTKICDSAISWAVAGPADPANSHIVSAMRFIMATPLLIRWLGVHLVAPQPAQRVGQDRATVLAVVPAVAVLEFVIVMGVFQRRRHRLVRQRPVAEQVVQV